jgi:hypothetical protein
LQTRSYWFAVLKSQAYPTECFCLRIVSSLRRKVVRTWSILALTVVFVPQIALYAQAEERGLLVRCDVDCIIAIDGKVMSVLDQDQEKLLPLTAGKHTLTSVSSSGEDIWETPIDFNGLDTVKVPVPLLATRAQRLQLESQTAGLKAGLEQRQQQLKNVSILQFRVVYKPGLFKVGKAADLRVSTNGIELFFPDGGVDTVGCSDIVRVQKGQSRGVSLLRNEFVIEAKNRRFYIIIDPSLPWSKFKVAPKAVNLITQQIRSACDK